MAPGRHWEVALPVHEAALPVVAEGVSLAIDHVQHGGLHAWPAASGTLLYGK